VTDKMPYGQVTDAIVGRDANTRFVNRNLKLEKSTTLGELAAKEHGSSQYWRRLQQSTRIAVTSSWLRRKKTRK